MKVHVGKLLEGELHYVVTFPNSIGFCVSQRDLQQLTALQNALDNDDDCYAKALERAPQDDEVAFMQARCDVILEAMNGL
jgi:hypothetical protein